MIPWDAILLYANEHDIQDDQRDLLFGVTRKCDEWVQEYFAPKKGKDKGKTADGGKGLGGGKGKSA